MIPISRTIGGGRQRDTASFCMMKAKRLLPTRNEESVVGPVLLKRRSRRCGRIRERCRCRGSCVTGCASCFVSLTLRAAYGSRSPFGRLATQWLPSVSVRHLSDATMEALRLLLSVAATRFAGSSRLAAAAPMTSLAPRVRAPAARLDVVIRCRPFPV